MSTESPARIYTVYMHTTPDGKRYIGVTRRDVALRWRNGKGYRRCLDFQSAIGMYGWANITHEVLCTGLTEADGKQAEKDYIAAHKTCDPLFGYNKTTGGDGTCGCFPSAETRAKKSEAAKGNKNALGHKMSDKGREVMRAKRVGRITPSETRAKISAALRGMKRTAETKQKMHDAQASRARAVECLTKDGESVGRFEYIVDAAKKTGIGYSSIQNACSGKSKTAGGYKWRCV